MKSFNVSPDINIVFTALWDISTLASFLWRRWWKDHGPGQKLPPSISSRTVRDQKVKCPPHQNIPLREQIEGKNVRDVKWTATVWFLNCILLWFSKKILLALDRWREEGGEHSFWDGGVWWYRWRRWWWQPRWWWCELVGDHSRRATKPQQEI